MDKKILVVLLLIFLVGCVSKEALEKEIRGKIEEANYCNENKDCKLEEYGCLGCSKFVNKDADLSEIDALIEEYSKIGPQLACLCAHPPDSAVCEGGKCVGKWFKPGDECVSDADCVTDGCSGTVCRSKDADPVYTTCEYRSYYSCYKLISCGCFEGKCVWDETEEFDGCIEQGGLEEANV